MRTLAEEGRADWAGTAAKYEYTGPDNKNNVLALAFGALIVGIVIAGSLWIMYHLNANMMVPGYMMDLHSQP